MYNQATSDDQLREVARKRIKRRRDLGRHLMTYVVINAFLVFIWAIGPRVSFWPAWLMVCWGIGLAFHAWYALGRQETTEAEVEAEMRRMRGSGSEAARGASPTSYDGPLLSSGSGQAEEESRDD